MSDPEPLSSTEPKPMCALVIVNWDYTGREFEELLYPEQDGEIMEKTLETAGYKHVKLVQNVKDIESFIKSYKEENQLLEMERFHFHFSGKHRYCMHGNRYSS